MTRPYSPTKRSRAKAHGTYEKSAIGPRVEIAVEEPLLDEIDERPRPEDAHELVERPEHDGEDRPAPDRVDGEAPEAARDVRPPRRARPSRGAGRSRPAWASSASW